MKFSNLLNQLSNMTQGDSANVQIKNTSSGAGGLMNKIPGGLAGGALAGGLASVLMSSKTMRKSATTVAKYGGAAALGGLAYKAYQNWQDNQSQAPHQQTTMPTHHQPEQIASAQQASLDPVASQETDRFQLALVKAMIASAKADGAIDTREQTKISEAINNMDIDDKARAELMNLFFQPIAIGDFIHEFSTPEQRAEAYFVSCLAIELDHDDEHAHLKALASALSIPPSLAEQLEMEAIGASPAAVV